MALSLQEQTALASDRAFMQRVQAAVAHHAVYVKNLGASAPGAQQMWSQRMLGGGSAQVAADLMQYVCASDAVVQTSIGDGSGVVDAALQTVVDGLCEFRG